MLVDRRLLDAPLLQPVDHWVVLVLSEHQIAHDQGLVFARLLEGRVGAKREPWLYINTLGGDAEVAARQVDAVDVAFHPLALFTDRLPNRIPVQRTSLFILCCSTTPAARTQAHNSKNSTGYKACSERVASIQGSHGISPLDKRINYCGSPLYPLAVFSFAPLCPKLVSASPIESLLDDYPPQPTRD